MGDHKHVWREIGRVFPFSERDFDPAYLSPDGGHVQNEAGEWELAPATHPDLIGKVPMPTPHIILQDQAGVDKHIEHVELTDDEWEKLRAAYESGQLDPDGNGTNRLLSTASLTQLGLGRIEKMLSFPSGAQEVLV